MNNSSEKNSSFDFHTHTTASDGAYTPQELLQKAADYGIDTLSITDHDTVSAYRSDVLQLAHTLGIRLVPGVEISTRDEDDTRFHILGLGIDVHSPDLLNELADMNQRRFTYAYELSKQLVSAGYNIDEQALFGTNSTITKAHIAETVISNPDNEPTLRHKFQKIPSLGEFIEALLLKGKEFYIPSPNSIHPEKAIEVIKKAGGLAILAHPMAAGYEGQDTKVFLDKVRLLPLDGIEAFYIYYARSLGDRRIDKIASYVALAKKLGLLISAGSDFHNDDIRKGRFVDLGFHNEPVIPPDSIKEDILNAIGIK